MEHTSEAHGRPSTAPNVTGRRPTAEAKSATVKTPPRTALTVRGVTVPEAAEILGSGAGSSSTLGYSPNKSIEKAAGRFPLAWNPPLW
jgi:hypothetical protein